MCTSFLAAVTPNFAITGRSLDYDQPSMFVNRLDIVGTVYNSVLNNGVTWTGTQAVFSVNFLVPDAVPFEAMNQSGLSMSGNLANADYPTGGTIVLSTDDMINYVLSQSASLSDAQALISQVSIQSDYQYHYSLYDRNGNSLIVEFVNGAAVFYNNQSYIMTNNPDLPWQLANQNNYANIRNYAPNAVLPDSGDQFHGQGMLGIPGDWMSTSRYTRTYYMLKYCLSEVSTSNVQDQVFFAKRLIEAASLLKGIDKGNSASGNSIYTQIQIVKDLINNVIYQREYGVEDWTVTHIDWITPHTAPAS